MRKATGTRSRERTIIPISCSVRRKHGRTAGVAALMTQGPPPDMPGVSPVSAPKVRCKKHDLRVSLKAGKLLCPQGHYVNDDGSPSVGYKDDIRGDRQ